MSNLMGSKSPQVQKKGLLTDICCWFLTKIVAVLCDQKRQVADRQTETNSCREQTLTVKEEERGTLLRGKYECFFKIEI